MSGSGTAAAALPGALKRGLGRGPTGRDASSKTCRTDDRHLLLVYRDGTFDGPTGHTRIMFGPTDDEVGVGPGTVTWLSDGTDIDVFEFTGPVLVWAHGVGGGGGRKSDRMIPVGGGRR